MLTMLNRMCWNTKSWLLPSHTGTDSGYAQDMGFGLEEWNFQLDDAVDGYVYGYLYYRPSAERIQSAGGHFHILFWGKHYQTNEELLVGAYENAMVPTDTDYLRVEEIFQEKGVFERRAEEIILENKLITYDQALSEVINAVRNKQLTFKCPIEAVHHYENYLPIKDLFPELKLGKYFTNPTFLDAKVLPIGQTLSPKPQTFAVRKPSEPVEAAYYRETSARLKMIIPQHNQMSNRFGKWLIKKGFKEIIQEENYVDVTFSKRNITYLAELKICYGAGTTRAVREALGQLLEYNFYPNRIIANQWFIVLDKKPLVEDVAYIENLRSELNLPLSLLWETSIGFEVATGEAL